MRNLLIFLIAVFPTVFCHLNWSDSNVFNTIYDTVRFQKTGDLSMFPNAVLMASISENSLVYRIETGDPSEDGHFWYCLDVEMCLSVYPRATKLGIYRLQKSIHIMAYTGRATFMHGVESFLYRGQASGGDDGEFPKEFCRRNEHGPTSQLDVQGYARTCYLWELVLCRPWQYLESVRNITFQVDQEIGQPLSYLSLHIMHRIQDQLTFDWTTLTFLKPDMQPQPIDKIFNGTYGVDFWEPSSRQLEYFRAEVPRLWRRTALLPPPTPKEHIVIQSLLKLVEKVVNHFAPTLSYFRFEPASTWNTTTIQRTLKTVLFMFGNISDTSILKQNIESCQLFFSSEHRRQDLSEHRKLGYDRVHASIQNVVREICTVLMPITVSRPQSTANSTAELLDTIGQLSWKLHWSFLERCPPCKERGLCMIGFPFAFNTRDHTLNKCFYPRGELTEFRVDPRLLFHPVALMPPLQIQKSD